MATDVQPAGEGTVPPGPVEEDTDGHKPRFTLPSAYTILFALIVLTAIATWIIPAGQYALDDEGSPIPGTYQEVDASPQRILIDSLDGADQRPVRHRGPGDRERRRVQRRDAVRRHRRRAVHPRDRRVHRHHDADRRHPGRHRPAGRAPAGPRAVDDPDPHDGLRHRRDDVRHGRGEPGVLRPRHHGDDRRGLRRHGRRAGHPPRRGHRRPRLDRQPLRHRHRLGLRRTCP